MQDNTTNQAISRIFDHMQEGLRLRESFFTNHAEQINMAALCLAATFAKGNKLILCGNGGSAADCQHLAAEFVNRFEFDRPPLPAIAITTDTSALTAIGNDFSFDEIFVKQVQALGKKGDILLGISTSGNSKNVLMALEAGRNLGMSILGFTGSGGGLMKGLCDLCFVVEGKSTALSQEVHISLGHLLCGLTDYYLFENVLELTPYLKGEKALPF